MKEYICWGAGTMAIKLKIRSDKDPEEFSSLMKWMNNAEDCEWIKTDCEEVNSIESVEERSDV